MGKDRRKDKAEEDEALGKQKDKYGKKGDGKIDPKAKTAKEEKSFTHQTCRHILVQKQSEALRISQEIHEGKISFNEAAFKYSEDKAGAHGLLGDKAQNEVRGVPCRTLGIERTPFCPACTLPPSATIARAARPGFLGGGAHMQGGRLAARACEDAVGLAPDHGAGALDEEEEVIRLCELRGIAPTGVHSTTALEPADDEIR
jgi:hypothetical protein